MTTRLQQFGIACQTFINRTRKQADVIGIIVSGSYIHGTVDAHSDIDVYVVLAPTCHYRRRGNTWINGVEIEYFMNPPQQIRAYLAREKSPHTAHMLTHGVLEYKASPEVERLIEEARQIMAQSPPPLKNFQIELGKYQLDDLSKDLADCRLNQNELAGILLRDQLLNAAIDLFCRKHQIHRTKHKRLHDQLGEVDPGFLAIVERVACAAWDRTQELAELNSYMARLLGGERGREWQLQSSLDL